MQGGVLMDIRHELSRRVLLLDGAMGTMIQSLGLSEADFRGEEFASHPVDLKGCNDLLCLTQPHLIEQIHRQYIAAGADIIETNTFNANAFSLAEYGLEKEVRHIARAGAEIARRAAGDDHFVAGSMGPTGIGLSLQGKDNDFDALAATYADQAAGLLEGGVDLLLIETAFDTLNVKAAICGIEQAQALTGRRVPLMISATLTESGRLLCGQDLLAFVNSVRHARPLSIGLNCGFGADGMIDHLLRLQDLDFYVSCHPNAGLPNELGQYTETPESMAAKVQPILAEGLVNIIGGCCGTTPEHIRAIAAIGVKVPKVLKALNQELSLSGLEPLDLPKGEFLRVGERCNVAGSRKFLRLISEDNYSEALSIAADQVRVGAKVLDISMDDAMLDAQEAMAEFVSLLQMDGRTAPAPLMIDSSNFAVIERALKLVQGRPIVNSISLKEGEDAFLDHARRIRLLGGIPVVMAFDEEGQADTFERKIEICRRAYNLLTQKAGFLGSEIIFDPNVLAVGTGIEAHNNYAVDFLRAAEWISQNLPGARTSGGVSNLSFAFRGNNELRKAMHALFIHHGMARGLDMAIMNPSAPIAPTPDMPAELLQAIDDLLFNRTPTATEKLLAINVEQGSSPAKGPKKPAQTLEHSNTQTLESLILTGSTTGLEPLLDEAVATLGSAMAVINGPLMAAMNRVGEEFGAGRMYLPQVVRAADVMAKAVEHLTPLLEADSALTEGPVVVLATVKGDVHDIGKNIVAVVLRCAGFRVVDLGVMVPAEKIVDEAIAQNAYAIGLSGLITPSLAEMAHVAELMQQRGLQVPLFVGGATTSPLHTAVKIAPLYSAPVVRTADAASLPPVLKKIYDPQVREQIAAEQALLRAEYEAKTPPLSLEEARRAGLQACDPASPPKLPGEHVFHPAIEELIPLINWRAFLGEWGMHPAGETAEARDLIARAKDLLNEFSVGTLGSSVLSPTTSPGVRTLEPSVPTKEGVNRVSITAKVLITSVERIAPETVRVQGVDLELPRRLKPLNGLCPSMADFVAPQGDHIGVFATCVTLPDAPSEEFDALLQQTVGHRLAEAATEWLHRKVNADLWGVEKSIRPAVGYSSLPDQRLIFSLDRLLDLQSLGITLTETGAMAPGSSTCGLILASPSARYF